MAFEQRLQSLLDLPYPERNTLLAQMPLTEKREFRWHWEVWARPEQLAPEEDWRCWLICAGRGFGKTRAGAEWIRGIVKRHRDARIALVAASLAEARAIMVEGESGVMACCPPDREPVYEPSLRRLTWKNGAMAYLYSAAEPESLRGPQHSHAWCDEIAKWENANGRAERAWDNLAMGMRLGKHPQTLATTTPRAVPLMRKLIEKSECGDAVLTSGTTYDNAAYLPDRFIEQMNRHYAGSSLGRQELEGKLLLETDGALWSRSIIESRRQHGAPEAIRRVVVGVDPPASAQGDACGIIVAGLTASGAGIVLADCSVEKASPERWARAAADAAQLWDADRIVAEANQGGAMVESVLRAANINLPVKLVHASRGKSARAEPVAALYEAGRITHSAMFGKLEDELCGMLAGGAYEGPGRSPDRADALVWALTELMLGRATRPRISKI